MSIKRDISNKKNSLYNEIKRHYDNSESGHDWSHTLRVLNNAMEIAKDEAVDLKVIELGALLHDIADSKFHDGDESIGSVKGREIMVALEIDEMIIEHVVNIINHISFKNSFEEQCWSSLELEILQDADRLDAIGAIGVARAFSYGGFKGRSFYDPKIPPSTNLTKETYKKSTAPTINHFYEKLLLLKDKMNTKRGRELAEQRHQFMLVYLNQFYQEIGGPLAWLKTEQII